MNMSDEHSWLRQTKIKLEDAQRTHDEAKQKYKELEQRFRDALPVSSTTPCSVAVLPSGRVVVHLWVDGRTETQLRVVQPGYFDEDARPRKKFPDEQLGKGK